VSEACNVDGIGTDALVRWSDFPYNEYLVIVSWKQLLHFLHIDWQVCHAHTHTASLAPLAHSLTNHHLSLSMTLQSWLVVVLAVSGAYMYVSLVNGYLGDVMLGAGMIPDVVVGTEIATLLTD
jgi:hypothetical protein